MFSKFNYLPQGTFYNNELNNFLDKGTKLYTSVKKEVTSCLSKYITESGIIKGSDLKDHWFKISEKDVFISHSHSDLYKVNAFTGWLEANFGLRVFIDSCTWGYCDELLKMIDDKYCFKSKTKTYDYNLRNYTTSHVHMMLSTALTEMLAKTECVIFFNTPNSIKLDTELVKIDKTGRQTTTISPWIYHELSMTTMLPCEKPVRGSSLLEHFSSLNLRDSLTVAYDVSKSVDSMVRLDDQTLIKWKNEFKKIPIVKQSPQLALDLLYNLSGLFA